MLVEEAGRAIGFALKRLNYASVIATVLQHPQTVWLRAAGHDLAPRSIEPLEDGRHRMLWVCPPAWTDSFPDEVTFVAKSEGSASAVVLARATPAGPASRRQWSSATRAPAAAHRAPFPPLVIERVNAVTGRNTDPGAFWSNEEIEQFLDDLKRIGRMAGRLGYLNIVGQYVGFLVRSNAAMQYALKHFCDINTTALRAERYHGIASHPDEMMTIAHHLYLLHSLGLKGDFAEFGCFKGFSTACLSTACAELGVRMHVFDSFQGLPESSSGRYITGEYMGSFDEVLQHVTDFGRPEAVTWHRGFFSESLKGFKSPLMALWMDVDLRESAQDLASVVSAIDVQGCVLSHEISAAAFIGREPNYRLIEAGKYEVLPPIFDAVRARGGVPSGEHLGRSLGAVYLSQSAQVLSYPYIAKLLELAD